MIRTATVADIPDLVDVINDAYLVEAYFVSGPRVNREAVSALMARGRFLLHQRDPDRGRAGAVDACVYIESAVPRGYLGLLSVVSAAQRRGLGAAMLEAAERTLAETCDTVAIHVVDLRRELLPFYAARGYVQTGTLPFEDVDRLIPPHTHVTFVVMEKPLQSSGGLGGATLNPGNT